MSAKMGELSCSLNSSHWTSLALHIFWNCDAMELGAGRSKKTKVVRLGFNSITRSLLGVLEVDQFQGVSSKIPTRESTTKNK